MNINEALLYNIYEIDCYNENEVKYRYKVFTNKGVNKQTKTKTKTTYEYIYKYI